MVKFICYLEPIKTWYQCSWAWLAAGQTYTMVCQHSYYATRITTHLNANTTLSDDIDEFAPPIHTAWNVPGAQDRGFVLGE